MTDLDRMCEVWRITDNCVYGRTECVRKPLISLNSFSCVKIKCLSKHTKDILYFPNLFAFFSIHIYSVQFIMHTKLTLSSPRPQQPPKTTPSLAGFPTPTPTVYLHPGLLLCNVVPPVKIYNARAFCIHTQHYGHTYTSASRDAYTPVPITYDSLYTVHIYRYKR